MDSILKEEDSFEDMRCCRACLTVADQNELDDYIDLLETYNSESNTPTLLDAFNKYAQLEIVPGDFYVKGYPPCHYLCFRCRQDLRQACEFITRAQLNNQLLMGKYSSSQLDIAAEELQRIKNTTELKTNRVRKGNVNRSEIGAGWEKCAGKDLSTTEYAKSTSDFANDEIIPDMIDEEVLQINDQLNTVVAENDSSQNSAHSLITVERVISCQKDHVKSQKEEDDEANSINSYPCDAYDTTRKSCFDFKCEFCTSIFEFQRDLLHHYELDHVDKNRNFPCAVCQNRFATKNALRLHRRQVHENDEYIDCEYCGRSVLKSFHNVHLKGHSQIKFLCSKCPKICASNNTLRKHMQLHSDDRDRNIECGDCGKRFYTNESLQLHQTIHISPEERAVFECTICSKTFLRKTNLSLHMQMHRGQTKDCPYCAKKFVRAKDLEVHIRFHTGDFPYACSMCDRKFAIKGHLNYHEKRHLGVRYKCDECEKTFINLAGLRQHQYEHTGMPLLCGICKRGFPTNFKIRRHLRTVHRHVFKKTGYTDALAKKYITPAIETHFETTRNTELDEACEDTIEMLEEHAGDIPLNLLKN